MATTTAKAAEPNTDAGGCAPKDRPRGGGPWADRQSRIRRASRSADVRAEAARLFDAKWGNVQKVCDFRGRHGGLDDEAIGDISQAAGLALWRQCLKAVVVATTNGGAPPFEIDCGVIARAGFMEWKRDADRHRSVWSLSGLDGPGDADKRGRGIPDRPRTIHVDGIELNATDARLDHPVECEHHYGRLLTARQAAVRLGVSRQYVYQITDKLGMVRRGCCFGFPLDIVARRAERGRRTPRKGARA